MSAADAGAPLAAAFARAVPFGHLAGVPLPAADDAVGLEALVAALPPGEQAHARGLPLVRRVTWVGGRSALRRALAELGVGVGVAGAPGPILATPRGAPVLPAGVAGSIAHKRTLAVALAAAATEDVTLGVDVEIARAPRVDISARVLTEAERRRLAALAEPARARAVLAAFAAKEAVYKALDPWLGRFVSFHEVELDGPTATFTPRAGEPSFEIEVREEPLPGHLLVTARVRRRAR